MHKIYALIYKWWFGIPFQAKSSLDKDIMVFVKTGEPVSCDASMEKNRAICTRKKFLKKNLTETLTVANYFEQQFAKKLITAGMQLDLDSDQHFRNAIYVYKKSGEPIDYSKKIQRQDKQLLYNNEIILSKFDYDMQQLVFLDSGKLAPADVYHSQLDESIVTRKVYEEMQLVYADNGKQVDKQQVQLAEQIITRKEYLSTWVYALSGKPIENAKAVPIKIGTCHYFRGLEVVRRQEFLDKQWVYADTGEYISSTNANSGELQEIIRHATYVRRQYIIEKLQQAKIDATKPKVIKFTPAKLITSSVFTTPTLPQNKPYFTDQYPKIVMQKTKQATPIPTPTIQEKSAIIKALEDKIAQANNEIKGKKNALLNEVQNNYYQHKNLASFHKQESETILSSYPELDATLPDLPVLSSPEINTQVPSSCYSSMLDGVDELIEQVFSD